MGVIIIVEDTEILEAIKFYLEKKLNKRLIKPERVRFIEEKYLFGYKINSNWLYTIIAGGYNEVLKFFEKIIQRFYNIFEQDNVQSIFLYFDKDVENEVRKRLKELKVKYQELEIYFEQNKGKYKDFEIYFKFLGKNLELCNMKIVPEFETCDIIKIKT